jgi:ABC-type Na+ efflux pump permease subunit
MRVLVVCGVVMFAFFVYMLSSMVHQAERANDAADAIVARFAR